MKPGPRVARAEGCSQNTGNFFMSQGAWVVSILLAAIAIEHLKNDLQASLSQLLCDSDLCCFLLEGLPAMQSTSTVKSMERCQGMRCTVVCACAFLW